MVLVAFLACSFASISGQVRLPKQQADELLLKSADPVYPAIAKIMKLQGIVTLDITVSEGGVVTAAELISGDLAFKVSAIDAAKKRRYKPYVVDGRPTPFITTVDFHFSQGIPDDKYEKDKKISQEFFPKEERCRDLIRQKQWSNAEADCREALDLANQFPYQRELEKSGSYQSLGMVLVGEKRYADAISLYRQSLNILRSRLTEHDAELGEVYAHIAIAYHLLGDFNNAFDAYRRAEKIYQAAYNNFGEEDPDEETQRTRQNYLKTWKNILNLHLKAAEDAGNATELDEVRKAIHNLP